MSHVVLCLRSRGSYLFAVTASLMNNDHKTRHQLLQSKRRLRVPAAFTLVEMLVVMGIISLLAVVSLPSLRGLGQTGLRRSAVSAVMNALDRARVMAISDGRATYVVFACKTTGETQVNPALWGRAYAIFQDADNIDFQPQQRTPWLYLPTSMAFKVDGNTPSVTNRPLDSTDPAFPLSAVANPPSVATGTSKALLPYLKFDSTGMVDEQKAELRRVLMFLGTVDSTGAEVSLKNSGSGGSAFSLEEVDVTLATGRARYIDNPADNLATPAPQPAS